MTVETRQQVNIRMPRRLIAILDCMRNEDEHSHGGFACMLIKAEYKRRQRQIMLPKAITAV